MLVNMEIKMSDISTEITRLLVEVKTLDNESLIDEVGLIMAELDVEKEIESIILRYFNTGILSKSDKKQLEYLYILSYSNLGIEV